MNILNCFIHVLNEPKYSNKNLFYFIIKKKRRITLAMLNFSKNKMCLDNIMLYVKLRRKIGITYKYASKSEN